MAVSYNKNTDYQALINKSVSDGDLSAAAQYEQKRNAKIVGEGIDAATTSKYVDNLPSRSYINTMYDNQKKSTLAGLKEAYDKNVSSVAQNYDAQKREVTGNADVQRKNMNELFAANGLNTGAVGQANLALGNQRTANLGNLSAAQAAKTADIETAYQSEVQKAIADSDFNRAKALYAEYQADQDRERQAQEQAKSMAQNQVDALLKMGVKPSDALVSQSGYSPDYVNQYYNAYLAQLQSTASGGSGGNGRNYSPKSDDTETEEQTENPNDGTAGSAFFNQYVQNTAAANAAKNMDSNTKAAYLKALSSQGLISDNTAKAIQNKNTTPTTLASGLKYNAYR